MKGGICFKTCTGFKTLGMVNATFHPATETFLHFLHAQKNESAANTNSLLLVLMNVYGTASFHCSYGLRH